MEQAFQERGFSTPSDPQIVPDSPASTGALDMMAGPSRRILTLLGLCFAVPAAHPLLIPLVGVPSHLLWWIHVLPVAFFTYRFGRRGAAATVGVSAALVVLGERAFGAGYGTPATWETALSLGVALVFTNALVAAFALYARTMTQRYQLLFEGVTLGVLRTDRDGVIHDGNSEAEEILEASRDRLRGHHLQQVFDDPSFESVRHLAGRRGGWTGRLERASKDGDGRPLHAFLAAIEQPDGRGYQVLIADRSLEVLQEQELQRKSKLASLGETLAGVAHELKNPLSAIIGHAQLGLMDETPRDELLEILEVVDSQAERMKELVQELLGFSRSDQESRIADLETLISRIVRVQRIALPGDVELETRFELDDCRIYASPTKVEQIVLNLISNAADAIGDVGDGGRITVACRARDDDAIEVEVHDDGPGIPEDVLSRIFQPFVTTKGEDEGTGLGLAISRRLAHSMSGELEARNRSGDGASFVLTLPRSDPRSREELDPEFDAVEDAAPLPGSRDTDPGAPTGAPPTGAPPSSAGPGS